MGTSAMKSNLSFNALVISGHARRLYPGWRVSVEETLEESHPTVARQVFQLPFPNAFTLYIKPDQDEAYRERVRHWLDDVVMWLGLP